MLMNQSQLLWYFRWMVCDIWRSIWRNKKTL